jgi:hypothetical protein
MDVESDVIEFTLPVAEERSERGDIISHDRAAFEPRVRLPRDGFDCVSLEALKDHPIIDTVLRAELERGAPFRLLRFPFSIAPPAQAIVTEVHVGIGFHKDGRAAGPRVHAIYPMRVETDHQVTTEVALQPSLKLGDVAELGAGRIGRSVTVSQGRASVVGLWAERGADWVLRAAGDPAGVEGTWEFVMVVRWDRPADALTASLAVSASLAASQFLWRTRRVEHRFAAIQLAGCGSITG